LAQERQPGTRLSVLAIRRPRLYAAGGRAVIDSNSAGYGGKRRRMAEREGLPRGLDKSKKISHLLYARWLRVYQPRVPMSMLFARPTGPDSIPDR
jgi:hypothetical protein